MWGGVWRKTPKEKVEERIEVKKGKERKRESEMCHRKRT